MKEIAICFVLFVLVFVRPEKAMFFEDLVIASKIESVNPDSLLNDGWYTAQITYSNHKKITKTTSKLKVQVSNDKVVKIELSNGKVLEANESNSDYFFSGGVLNFEYDLRIKSTIAKTSVKIKYNNGELSFYDIAIL